VVILGGAEIGLNGDLNSRRQPPTIHGASRPLSIQAKRAELRVLLAVSTLKFYLPYYFVNIY
jgi:hypothetical protein